MLFMFQLDDDDEVALDTQSSSSWPCDLLNNQAVVAGDVRSSGMVPSSCPDLMGDVAMWNSRRNDRADVLHWMEWKWNEADKKASSGHAFKCGRHCVNIKFSALVFRGGQKGTAFIWNNFRSFRSAKDIKYIHLFGEEIYISFRLNSSYLKSFRYEFLAVPFLRPSRCSGKRVAVCLNPTGQ